MTPRQQWFQFAASIASAILAAILTRYGIPIQVPPFPVPPAQPPIVIMPPASPPPAVVPPAVPPSAPAAMQALCRLQFGNVGCTATIVGPQRPDGTWDVLTAAHCCEGVGQEGVIRLKDGRTVGVRVKSRCAAADCAWMVTKQPLDRPAYAMLASASPPAGTAIWHAGYGVDNPGNTERGTVLAGPDGNGQLKFRLSVSSGDSGGGIIDQQTGRVISCVCCTTRKGVVADVWGACPEVISNCRPDR